MEDHRRIDDRIPGRISGPEPLGSRARWARVGYEGRAHAPTRETYACLDALRVRYTTVHDSGRAPSAGPELANLHPLIAATLYEAGFAYEAGPLSTWTN